MSDSQDWDYWIDKIMDTGVNLSAWETDFIESVQAQRKQGRPLTDKQAEILERIYAKTP